MECLHFNPLPQYILSSFRQFNEGECHVSRMFNENVLIFMLSGILRFSENDKPVELSAGQWYIQKAGLRQTGDVESSLPNYFYIHFNGLIDEFKINEPSMPLVGEYSSDEYIYLFNRLSKLEQQPDFYELEKNSLFLQILSLIKEKHESNRKQNTLSTRVAEYMSEHISEPITLSAVAKEFGYSQDYIIRVFRKQYGITPYKHLTNLRILSAKQLLLTTDYPIQKIAGECGFTDESVFYRSFTQALSLSPSKWRRKMSGTDED